MNSGVYSMINRKKMAALAMTAGCALMTSSPALSLDIKLWDVNGSVAASPAAQKGFKIAAKYWESVLTDNVTVRFAVDFSNLGPGILGGTGTNLATYVPTELYGLGLAFDATSTVDNKAVTNFPTLSGTGGVTAIVPDYLNPATQSGVSPIVGNSRIAPDGTAIANTIAMALPNFKSVFGDAGLEKYTDAYISFSSSFAFDFDPSDGVDPGTYDFIAVAIHEMGHALGFLSGVEDFDASTGLNFPVDDYWWAYSADLFRYSDQGDLDWTFGTDSYFSLDGGATAYMDGYWSTGSNFGDGWQASHWKAPGGCTNFLGIMNPYLCDGQTDDVKAVDLALLDAIGWDLAIDVDANPRYNANTADLYPPPAVPEPATWLQMIAGFGLLGGLMRGSVRGKLRFAFA